MHEARRRRVHGKTNVLHPLSTLQIHEIPELSKKRMQKMLNSKWKPCFFSCRRKPETFKIPGCTARRFHSKFNANSRGALQIKVHEARHRRVHGKTDVLHPPSTLRIPEIPELSKNCMQKMLISKWKPRFFLWWPQARHVKGSPHMVGEIRPTCLQMYRALGTQMHEARHRRVRGKTDVLRRLRLRRRALRRT